jgi:hypothetical protein
MYGDVLRLSKTFCGGCRCVPGYPQRPPKLHVVSKKGLSEEQSQSLHTMLVEQAASLAREGRVMVFNLMEAAQEFLSESSLTLHEVLHACRVNPITC